VLLTHIIQRHCTGRGDADRGNGWGEGHTSYSRKGSASVYTSSGDFVVSICTCQRAQQHTKRANS
jgi:hypothetical protein